MRVFRQVRSGQVILKSLLTCASAALALTAVLSGCRANNDPDLPPVTINNIFTAAPTEEPVSLVTTVPGPTPQSEVPVTFTDINFENAVREAIGRFLDDLPEQQRSMLLKRYWYLMSAREIAKDMQLPETRVRVTLMRLRNRLREYLEKEELV